MGFVYLCMVCLFFIRSVLIRFYFGDFMGRFGYVFLWLESGRRLRLSVCYKGGGFETLVFEEWVVILFKR